MKRIFLACGIAFLLSSCATPYYNYQSNVQYQTQEETYDGLPIIDGGSTYETHVAQVDRERMVVHHRKIRDRVDVYDENPSFTSRVRAYNPQPNNYYPQTIRTQWTENFACNSSRLDNCGFTNMGNIARFAREYPYSHFVIYGYADINTGTQEQNYWLSKARADKVRNEMVCKYNISSDRVEVHYMGCTEQPYGINNLNRCVLIKAY